MNVDYLRISVTDRCNLRCVYCDPMGDCGFIERSEILRFEEIHHIVKLFTQCGIKRVRLTGGEPLVRKNVVQLVHQLAGIGDIEDLSLTTNGVLFEGMAAELKAAGLNRVNISLDSADKENYKRITGSDFFEKVIRSIRKAIEVGLTPVKVNAVILSGLNKAQIPALAQMGIDLPIAVRFIEYYPTSGHAASAGDYIPNGEVRAVIEKNFGPLIHFVGQHGGGPAVYYKIKNSSGCIGFISGRSTFFCRSCNRLRLTSDGKVKPCLYSAYHYDVKKLIRDGAGDHKVYVLLKKVISEKSNYTKLNSFTEQFSMRNLGG